MDGKQKSDDLLREVHNRQRNTVFPDTVRNTGGFWRGLSTQRLNGLQWCGLLVLFAFYVIVFVGLFSAGWPEGSAPIWQKLVSRLGPDLLLSLPLVVFVIFMIRTVGRKK